MFFSIHLWPERVIELSYHLCCWVWDAKVLFFYLLNYFLKLKHCKDFHGFILKCQYPFLGYKSKYEGTFKVFSDQSSAHLIKCIRRKDPFLGTLMCLAWTNSDLRLVNCKLGKLFLEVSYFGPSVVLKNTRNSLNLQTTCHIQYRECTLVLLRIQTLPAMLRNCLFFTNIVLKI